MSTENLILEKNIELNQDADTGNGTSGQNVETISAFLKAKHLVKITNNALPEEREYKPFLGINASTEIIARRYNLKLFNGNQLEYENGNNFNNNLTPLLSQLFMASVPSATYDKNRNLLTVEINSFASASSEENALIRDIHYDFSIDNQGSPKINIYIRFDIHKLRSEQKNLVVRNSNITFSKESDTTFSKKSDTTQSIDLSTVRAIEVFLLQTNPRTSRGTMTTVKPTETTNDTNDHIENPYEMASF
jgi:hypothetical protein